MLKMEKLIKTSKEEERVCVRGGESVSDRESEEERRGAMGGNPNDRSFYQCAINKSSSLAYYMETCRHRDNECLASHTATHVGGKEREELLIRGG